MPVITVSQINKYIGFVLKGDKNLRGIMIKGEISNFVDHYRSGHLYFTLKDSESAIRAVMFASAASRLKIELEDGMSVIVSGSVGVYEKTGEYQIYVNDVLPDGAGAASAALEQLKRKLAKEGIFDEAHKRPLPSLPKKIGVVTSLTGAAVRDVINVLTRRYPVCEVYAMNALVQGAGAPDSVCRGILRAESAGCDVIIVGRGGGSSEDLSAFNTEKVAYAVYNCKVPVISAVGHEVDFTVCDLAADLRAPTPSAAAELAAPSIESLYERIDMLEERAGSSAMSAVKSCMERFSALDARLAAQSPENRFRVNKEKLANLEGRLKTAALRCIESRNAALERNIAGLEAMSPLKVLSRGYSLAYSGSELIKDSEKIQSGERIELRFAKGGASAEIIEKW